MKCDVCKSNIIDDILNKLDNVDKLDNVTTLICGVEAGYEIKRSEAMLNYGVVTPIGIKLFGLDIVVDSSFPKDKWIIK